MDEEWRGAVIPAVRDHLTPFLHLRADAVPGRDTAATLHRAPHKALLLLAVLDLSEEGVIADNLTVES